MKRAVSSLLLAASVCIALAVASPLSYSEQFDTTVTNLGNYFNGLAGELLRTEDARDRYNSHLYNTTDLLSSKFTELSQEAQELLSFSAGASEAVLTALTSGSSNVNTPQECCSGETSPCCQRCSDLDLTLNTNLRSRIANVAAVLDTTLASRMDSSDNGVRLEFGFAVGLVVQHPRPSGACVPIDSRTLSWFTFATSKPRVMAILIDLSFGISMPLKDRLIEGAKRLLSSLNPKDKVNVVLFGANSQSVGACRQFSSATAANVRYLGSFIDQYQDKVLGIANTSHFLSEAAGQVQALKGSSDAIVGQVVVFTTSHSSRYDGVFDTPFSNSAIKFSFVFFEDADVPRDIADLSNVGIYEMEENAFMFIIDQLVLGDTSASQLDWMITVDPQTGEHFVSITQPSVVADNLHGVFHSRIPLSLMTKTFSDFFGTKPVSYYFVTDYPDMSVVYHPRDGKGSAMSILELERVSELGTNFTSETTFTTTKKLSLSLGPSDKNGILNKALRLTYTCKPLFNGTTGARVPVVCAVVEEGESQDPVFRAYSNLLGSVVEQGFTPREDSCSFFTYEANTGYSSLRVSESLVPDSAAASQVNAFIRGEQDLEVANNVRVDASVAAELTAAWKRSSANSDIATWRYFGSYQGVYATYPAIAFPEEYNPRTSSWFRTASVPSVDPDVVRLIPASLDPFGSGYAYGISKKIQGNITYGVVSAALSLSSLIAYIEENVTLCSTSFECVLFDDAGNVIYHSNFKTTLPDSVTALTTSSRTMRFLSLALGKIIRSVEMCLDYANPGTVDRHFYNYEMINQRINSSETTCPKFLAQRVPGTNVMFAVSDNEFCSSFCTCSSGGTCAPSTCPVFSTPLQTCQCRCRCGEGTSEDDCSRRQPTEALVSASMCPPLASNAPQYKPVTVAPGGVATCQSAGSCSAIQNNLTCLSSASCLQCDIGCFHYSACCTSSSYTSGLLACTSRPTVVETPTEPNIVAIVVPVVLVIVFIILLLLALVVWYNLRVKGKGDTEHHTNVFDFSKDKANKTNPESAANGANGDDPSNHSTTNQTAKEKEAEAELDNIEKSSPPPKEDLAEITEQTIEGDTKV